eukprot:scaffold4247_cov174-Ochromonas_danica.AAC.8
MIYRLPVRKRRVLLQKDQLIKNYYSTLAINIECSYLIFNSNLRRSLVVWKPAGSILIEELVVNQRIATLKPLLGNYNKDDHKKNDHPPHPAIN